MADQVTPAFIINGTEFPIPTRYRLGDPVLVCEVSGLDFQEFAERQPTGGWLNGTDPQVLLGMIAVAVWQVNTRWSRSKVRRFVEEIDQDKFDFQLPEVEEVDDDDPLAEAPAEAESPSPESSGTSTTSPEPSEEKDPD